MPTHLCGAVVRVIQDGHEVRPRLQNRSCRPFTEESEERCRDPFVASGRSLKQFFFPLLEGPLANDGCEPILDTAFGLLDQAAGVDGG